MKYKIFCDESCHLQCDGWDSMVLGALQCKENEYEKIKNDIKDIKLRHKTPFELKWTKLSASRLELYKELIDYFCASNITYRAVMVKNKNQLNHKLFNQTHSEFYYKTYYLTLSKIMSYENKYKIYMDIKDTLGKKALNKLTEIFQNERKNSLPVPYMQHIRSDESQLLQLSDLLTGMVSYKIRNINTSKIKLELIQHIEKKLNISLNTTSSLSEKKFNRFIQDLARMPKSE